MRVVFKHARKMKASPVGTGDRVFVCFVRRAAKRVRLVRRAPGPEMDRLLCSGGIPTLIPVLWLSVCVCVCGSDWFCRLEWLLGKRLITSKWRR